MKKVFISTPAYDGKVHVQYATSLVDTVTLLLQNGYMPEINILSGGSLLIADRNKILEAFWKSDCEYLLCIDSDLGWDARAVHSLLVMDKEFSGGVYPSRMQDGFVFRPCVNEDGSLVLCPTTKLIKVEYIPAGFMLLKRSALQKIRDKFPELKFAPKDPRNTSGSGYCLFNTEVYEGEFWGEDYVFCRRAREAGVDIWVNPMFPFDHAGKKGALISMLSEKPPQEQDNGNTK